MEKGRWKHRISRNTNPTQEIQVKQQCSTFWDRKILNTRWRAEGEVSYFESKSNAMQNYQLQTTRSMCYCFTEICFKFVTYCGVKTSLTFTAAKEVITLKKQQKKPYLKPPSKKTNPEKLKKPSSIGWYFRSIAVISRVVTDDYTKSQ